MNQGRDKRKFRRLPLSFPLTMSKESSSQASGVDCLLMNLSLEGAAIQSAKPLEPGTRLSFSFPLTLEDRCVVEESKVVHSKPQSGPGYLAGIRLTRFQEKDHFKLARYLRTLRLIQNTTLLFQKLSLDEVRQILRMCRHERLEKGRRLFSEHDSANALYIVAEGAIKLTKRKTSKEEEVLAVVEDGEVFGEMAILDGFPRAASAIAERSTLLLSIDRDRFQQLVDERGDLAYRVMWIFLRLLCHRLRLADKRFVEFISSPPGPPPLSSE